MPRPVTCVAAGVVTTACALAVAAGAAVPGRRDVYDVSRHLLGSRPVWYWPGWFWIITAALALTGVVLAVRPATRRRAAAVSAVLSAQLAGRAVVAVRDWFNANGAGTVSMLPSDLATRVTIAAGIAVAATVAGSVAVALLWREPRPGRAAWRPRNGRLAGVGASVAILPPMAALIGAGGGDAVMQAGTVALTAALPWGGTLAAAAWLGPRAQRATVRTVLGCAVAFAVSLGLAVVR